MVSFVGSGFAKAWFRFTLTVLRTGHAYCMASEER
jgi:hypothetical protein